MEPVIRGYQTAASTTPTTPTTPATATTAPLDVPALLAALRLIEANHDARIQLVRADRVHGRDHLRLAALLAARAIVAGRARAADLPTETVLYAAGERQVGRAIATMGLDAQTGHVAAIAWGARAQDALDAAARTFAWRRDDACLEGDASVLDALGIPMGRRAVIPRERWGELVLEKVALVDVAKP